MNYYSGIKRAILIVLVFSLAVFCASAAEAKFSSGYFAAFVTGGEEGNRFSPNGVISIFLTETARSRAFGQLGKLEFSVRLVTTNPSIKGTPSYVPGQLQTQERKEVHRSGRRNVVIGKGIRLATIDLETLQLEPGTYEIVFKISDTPGIVSADFDPQNSVDLPVITFVVAPSEEGPTPSNQ